MTVSISSSFRRNVTRSALWISPLTNYECHSGLSNGGLGGDLLHEHHLDV